MSYKLIIYLHLYKMNLIIIVYNVITVKNRNKVKMIVLEDFEYEVSC
jgi:hypothetical protein